MTAPRTILITGATDGIGQALAASYHADGARLVLVGRKPLAAVRSDVLTEETYCRADLSSNDAHEVIGRFVTEREIDGIDVLVHNAAVALYGAPADESTDAMRGLLDVNLRAPIQLTHTLLPALRHARGKVVFVSSVAAWFACAEYAAYAASKAALDGFARSLAIEVRGELDVQIIHPGATRTGMHEKAGIPRDKIDWKRFPAVTGVAGRIRRAIDGRAARRTIGIGNAVAGWVGRLGQ